MDLTGDRAAPRGHRVRRALGPRSAPGRGRPPQAKRVVRMANGVLITETPHGFVCANGGVDASNVGPGVRVDRDAAAGRSGRLGGRDPGRHPGPLRLGRAGHRVGFVRSAVALGHRRRRDRRRPACCRSTTCAARRMPMGASCTRRSAPSPTNSPRPRNSRSARSPDVPWRSSGERRSPAARPASPTPSSRARWTCSDEPTLRVTAARPAISQRAASSRGSRSATTWRRTHRAATVEDAARDQVGLHATDPTSVYLSAWARVDGLDRATMERALYDDRTLVRMIGMRRTLFLEPLDLAPDRPRGHAVRRSSHASDAASKAGWSRPGSPTRRGRGSPASRTRRSRRSTGSAPAPQRS